MAEVLSTRLGTDTYSTSPMLSRWLREPPLLSFIADSIITTSADTNRRTSNGCGGGVFTNPSHSHARSNAGSARERPDTQSSHRFNHDGAYKRRRHNTRSSSPTTSSSTSACALHTDIGSNSTSLTPQSLGRGASQISSASISLPNDILVLGPALSSNSVIKIGKSYYIWQCPASHTDKRRQNEDLRMVGAWTRDDSWSRFSGARN